MHSLWLIAAQEGTGRAQTFEYDSRSRSSSYSSGLMYCEMHHQEIPSLDRLHLCRIFRSICCASFCLEHALRTCFVEDSLDRSAFGVRFQFALVHDEFTMPTEDANCSEAGELISAVRSNVDRHPIISSIRGRPTHEAFPLSLYR